MKENSFSPQIQRGSLTQMGSNVALRFILLLLLCIPMLRASVWQRRRDSNAYAQLDIYNIIDIVAIFFLAFLCLCQNKKIFPSLKTAPAKYYVGYYLFCILSLFWAVRLEIFYTPYRALEMIITLCGCILFCKLQKDEKLCYKMIMNFCSVIWIPKVIQIYLTHKSFEMSYYHTNNYTIIGLIAFLMALSAYLGKLFPLRKILLPLVSGAACLCIGHSSASFISAIIGVWLLCSLRKGKANIFLMLFVSGLGLFFWNYWSDEILQFIFPNKSMKLIMTGTGRIDMWNFYIEAWKKSPMLGYGFPVGEKEAQLFGWVQTSSSHNAFISVLINTGILGMCFFFSFLLTTVKKLYKNCANVYQRGLFATIIAIIINSCSLPVLGSSWSYSTTPALLCFAMFMAWFNRQDAK